MERELISYVENGLGRLVLNRPQALNALSMEMYRGLLATLEEWAKDDGVRAVLITGAGERAFCAGGDIRALWDAKARGDADYMAEIFRVEYRLNRLINRYPKPYVALMDGIAMGGGLGVSVHGSHRIVTERSLLAMPEVGIGFFPDVGASWFLPRCPGRAGLYLAMTGTAIGPADAIWAGLADAMVPSRRLERLAEELEKGADIDQLIIEYADDPGPSPLAAMAGPVDRDFAGASVSAILERCDEEAAQKLGRASPFSLAVAFEAQKRGAGLAIEEVMIMEYRLCRRMLERYDLFEGIRAAVIDKDRNPRWNPEVDAEAVAACFAPLGEEDLIF